MRVPVLAYHAANISGPDYAQNDQIALAADLASLHREGWRVVPLSWVVEQRLGLAQRDLDRCVALSCDDGTDLDWRGVEWPDVGYQPGLRAVLLAFVREHGRKAQPNLSLSCFVIASPDARERMDSACLHARGWIGEDWWPAAQRSGLLSIECHSWDHNHACLGDAGLATMPRGDFFAVDDPQRARFEIDQALEYINARLTPSRCRLFCYPYGHVAPYLRDEYLPANAQRLGLLGAFGDAIGPVTMDSPVWNLPRFICGPHWSSPQQLLTLLNSEGRTVP
jgi:hypothetical protein